MMDVACGCFSNRVQGGSVYAFFSTPMPDFCDISILYLFAKSLQTIISQVEAVGMQ